MEETALDLFRRYARQQREFAYPDFIRSSSGGEGAADDAAPGGAGLDGLRAELGECTRCPLHARRNKIVFGAGNPNADLFFVGEGPGGEEDRIGEPFVGAAGKLLDRIFAAAGIARDEVYITNVVKCRPPGNRNPEIEEIVACAPFLRKQIELVNPRILCALGRFAAQTLLGNPESVGSLRGRWHDWEGRRLIVTYHPSACLHNSTYKRPVWEDFQMLRDEYRVLRPS